MSKKIIVLDFDGVICDSAGETGVSGWKACHELWPDLFPKAMPSAEDVDAFRKVRPFLETGFDAIILTKMLQEKIPFQEYEKNIKMHFARIMEENSLTREQLIELFGRTRDNWIKENLQEWLGWHGFFDGVLEALNSALKSDAKLLISTTKQERFVIAALRSHDCFFPEENIYGLERKCKKEVLLAQLLQQNPSEMHFVEDRIQTLQRVEAIHELDSVHLHYATWGYGTTTDLHAAQSDTRLNLFSRQEFCDWLS